MRRPTLFTLVLLGVACAQSVSAQDAHLLQQRASFAFREMQRAEADVKAAEAEAQQLEADAARMQTEIDKVRASAAEARKREQAARVRAAESRKRWEQNAAELERARGVAPEQKK